ncbi:MAG: hypothetical protein JNM39_05780 [Bdellovibrionaceae bacterium]|nr:hypothetical protein [Pseudobdellovibrionaceae bacterium]
MAYFSHWVRFKDYESFPVASRGTEKISEYSKLNRIIGVAKKLFLIQFLTAVLSGSTAFCYDTCDKNTLAKDRLVDIKQLNEKIGEGLENANTYFETACRFSEGDSEALNTKKLKSLINKPDTSALRTTIPFSDEAGNKTQDFLKKVSEKIHARHDFNKKLASDIAVCTNAQETPANLVCKGLNSWLEKELPQISRLARFNLAMAHQPTTAGPLRVVAEKSGNSLLEESKSTKQIPWNQLSLEELQIVNESFDSLKKEIGREFGKGATKLERGSDSIKYVDQLQKVQRTYYMIYLSFMGINPILQFIKSEAPTKAEINHAATLTLKNLEKEKAFLDEIDNAIAKPFNVGRSGAKSFKSEILHLMKYRTEVEEVLLENPEFCGLGVALNQVDSNREITAALASLPIFAASFFVPPLYGLAIAGLTSGYYIFDSQKKLDEGRIHHNARIQREGMNDLIKNISTDGKSSDEIRKELENDVTWIYRKDLMELRQREADRNISIVLAPVAVISPLAAKYLASFGRSMRAAFSPAP